MGFNQTYPPPDTPPPPPASNLPCPKCGEGWFVENQLTAVVLVNVPRIDLAVRRQSLQTASQWSYVCNNCGYELDLP